jgi:nucleotide-binding universal stress UspA family protein
MAKRMLVALDRVPESEDVVPLVGDAARSGGATVRLLHVAPVPEQVVDEAGRVLAYSDQEGARLEAAALDFLRTVEARLEGTAVESAVRFGAPAEEIVAEAEAFGADLIVLVSPRRSCLSRMLLGSTSEEVCRRTATDVVIYRTGAHERA